MKTETRWAVIYKMMTSKKATRKLVTWSKDIVMMSLDEMGDIVENINEIGV